MEKLPPTTAHVMGVFAKELAEEGFSEDRITALLIPALQHELKGPEGLMIFDA